MKISIITVCRNSEATIRDTIKSVLAQSYPDIEHIIIDGSSSDGTMAIIDDFGNRTAKVVSEPDKGIYDAMNKGIALARGDYIGTLNADDVFTDKSSLEKIVNCLKTSNTDAVFSCLDIVGSANQDRVMRKYRVSNFSPFMLRIGLMPPHPTFYCKRSCYEKAGPFRLDFRIAADFEMLARLLLKHHITWAFLAETTVKMRSGGMSNRGVKAKLQLNREIIRACKENGLYTNMFLLALKLPIRLLECIT